MAAISAFENGAKKLQLLAKFIHLVVIQFQLKVELTQLFGNVLEDDWKFQCI